MPRSNPLFRSTGTGSTYDAAFFRANYSLTDRWGVRLRFKVDNVNTNAHFPLEGNDTTYRRFGVIAGGGTISVQYLLDGGTWMYPATLIPAVQINSWYVVQLTIDAAGQLIALVFPENNPSAAATYRVAMPAGKAGASITGY